MRAFIHLLLAISLSWVTTGYACRMDGLNVVRARCCCPHAHKPDHAAKADQATLKGADHPARCCDIVASAALDDHQPGVLAQAPVLDLPVFALVPHASWNALDPSVRTVAALSPARGPPCGSGARTYLTTARLRL